MLGDENKDFVKKALKRIDTDAGIDVDAALFKAFLITLGGLTDIRVLTGAVMAYEVLARINTRRKEEQK